MIGYAEIELILADMLLRYCHRYTYLLVIRIPCNGQ